MGLHSGSSSPAARLSNRAPERRRNRRLSASEPGPEALAERALRLLRRLRRSPHPMGLLREKGASASASAFGVGADRVGAGIHGVLAPAKMLAQSACQAIAGIRFSHRPSDCSSVGAVIPAAWPNLCTWHRTCGGGGGALRQQVTRVPASARGLRLVPRRLARCAAAAMPAAATASSAQLVLEAVGDAPGGTDGIHGPTAVLGRRRGAATCC